MGGLAHSRARSREIKLPLSTREEETLQVVGFSGFQGQFVVEGWGGGFRASWSYVPLCLSLQLESYQSHVATGLLPGPSAALIGD